MLQADRKIVMIVLIEHDGDGDYAGDRDYASGGSNNISKTFTQEQVKRLELDKNSN